MTELARPLPFLKMAPLTGSLLPNGLIKLCVPDTVHFYLWLIPGERSVLGRGALSPEVSVSWGLAREACGSLVFGRSHLAAAQLRVLRVRPGNCGPTSSQGPPSPGLCFSHTISSAKMPKKHRDEVQLCFLPNLELTDGSSCIFIYIN